MTREQMIAHLEIHGWQPMAFQSAWKGMMNMDSVLVHLRVDGADEGNPGVRVVRAWSSFAAQGCDSTWALIPWPILRECYKHIVENRL